MILGFVFRNQNQKCRNSKCLFEIATKSVKVVNSYLKLQPKPKILKIFEIITKNPFEISQFRTSLHCSKPWKSVSIFLVLALVIRRNQSHSTTIYWNCLPSLLVWNWPKSENLKLLLSQPLTYQALWFYLAVLFPTGTTSKNHKYTRYLPALV